MNAVRAPRRQASSAQARIAEVPAAPVTATPGLRVHIDRLVVDAALLAPGQERALREAFTEELARLLGERDLAPALLAIGAVAELGAGTVGGWPGSDGGVLGHRVAGAVHRALHGHGHGGAPP
jgi:hypothetical protein